MKKERHCDPVTMDHIIELRRQLAEAERQRDNALNVATKTQRKLWLAQDIAFKIFWEAETAKTNAMANDLLRALNGDK